MEIGVCGFCENMSGKFNFFLKPDRITGYLREDLCKFIISRGVLLIMRNISAKVAEKTKTHILYSITFFRKSFPF